MESSEFNPQLKAVYVQAVETQLRDNIPPETRQTFDRLRREGVREEDAKLLIASVIAVESFEVMKTKQPFNHERFVHNLNRLPNQDFDVE